MKTALVTGANTGMGFETAKALVSEDIATVLACRNLENAQQARDRLKREFPGAKVEAARLDLSDLDSVREFGRRARATGKPLDILCNNAGVMACPEQRTKEGFEMQLAVNHLGHFLLTGMLLPLMMDPASFRRPARIINVSSSAHLMGKIDFEDLQSRKSYSKWGAYGQSKLANILFTYELAKRLPSHVTANTLHPGIVQTELARHLMDLNPPWWKVPLQLPLLPVKLFLKTPQKGAATQIHLCLSPQVEGVTGKYFVDCKPKSSSKASYDAATARRLWDVSKELTGAEDFF